MLGEVAAIQAKLVQVVAGNEAEWNQLSRIIQQDRQARVIAQFALLATFKAAIILSYPAPAPLEYCETPVAASINVSIAMARLVKPCVLESGPS